jgi:hypothetical protein
LTRAHVVPKSFVKDGGTGAFQSIGRSASVYSGIAKVSGISAAITTMFLGGLSLFASTSKAHRETVDPQ